jgi:hypothetical protein
MRAYIEPALAFALACALAFIAVRLMSAALNRQRERRVREWWGRGV